MADVIVVGSGLCGAALAYELAQQGAGVLLLEAAADIAGATRYSYGGIAYWAGNTPLTQELCRAARARHPQLPEELGHGTQFRPRELLLTVEAGKSPAAIADNYRGMMQQPEVLTAAEACRREPLLNPGQIGGALAVEHGQVCPLALTRAYHRAFERLGGKIQQGRVDQLLRRGDAIQGVQMDGQVLTSAQVVLSAGAWSREILQHQGVELPLYFSHAEMVEIPQAEGIEMQCLVMPAEQKRFALEAQLGQGKLAQLWQAREQAREQTGAPAEAQALVPPVLDAGVIQFCDGRIALGQISRIQPGLAGTADAQRSEAALRGAVRSILPAIADLPGQWHSTRVAFSGDGLALMGPVPGLENLHLFTGFSSPFVYAIPLAQRFAQAFVQHSNLGAAMAADPWLRVMVPGRFRPEA